MALAAGALVAAWRLEAAPRRPQRLLRVRAPACTSCWGSRNMRLSQRFCATCLRTRFWQGALILEHNASSRSIQKTNSAAVLSLSVMRSVAPDCAIGVLMAWHASEGGARWVSALVVTRAWPAPVQALLVLEAAQQRRRVSAPLRLAATGLYSLLGAPAAAAESFGALDVKHIQHDTLSGARLCWRRKQSLSSPVPGVT